MDSDIGRNNSQTSNTKFEPLVLFFISALFIFLGQAIAPAYPEAKRWIFWIYTFVGMFCVFLAAHAFGRGHLVGWFVGPLASASRWLGVRPSQLLLIIAAPFVSFATWLAAGDGGKMLEPLIAISTWLLAIGFVIVGHWSSQKDNVEDTWSRSDTIIAIGFFVLAVCLRGIYLGRIPWVLSGDEGSAGLSAVEFINGTRDNIFGLAWFSFPAMFFQIQSIPIRILGQTTTALRFSSMIAGALTIPALYWYTRKTYSRTIGILSSAFLACLHFHIHFSRIGLNNIWDGLFFALFSGALFKAWSKENSPSGALSFVGAGLILGIGQYFYSSIRVLFAVFFAWLIFVAMRDWRGLRMRFRRLVSMFISILVSILPLASFYIKHPQDFSAPFQRVSIMGSWMEAEMLSTGKPVWLILAAQFQKAALAFTHVNLRNWYNPDHPMLLVLPSALFIMGIVLLIMRLFQPKYTWIAIWLLSAVSIAALSESTPAAQRLTFVAPCIAIIVVLPLQMLMHALSTTFPRRKYLVLATVAVMIIALMVGDAHFYFVEYSGNQKFGDNNTETANAVARYLKEIEPGPTVYFFGPPRMGYFSHSTIPYLAPKAQGVDVPEPLQEPVEFTISSKTVFIFLPERSQEMDLVRQIYPQGRVIEQYGRNNILLFIAYQIDG